MMGIVVPERCWAYKNYNKIIRSVYLVLILRLSQWCTVQNTSEFLNLFVLLTGMDIRQLIIFFTWRNSTTLPSAQNITLGPTQNIIYIYSYIYIYTRIYIYIYTHSYIHDLVFEMLLRFKYWSEFLVLDKLCWRNVLLYVKSGCCWVDLIN